MLYQMMLLTRQDFRAAQLQVSPKAPEYFTSTCKHLSFQSVLFDAHLSISSGQLKKDPAMFHWSIKTRLRHLREVSDEEGTEVAGLIERCLILNPADRSTAAELLSDPWFDGVE